MSNVKLYVGFVIGLILLVFIAANATIYSNLSWDTTDDTLREVSMIYYNRKWCSD